MDLKFDVEVGLNSWTISWDDRQEARFREVTGQWLSNAVDRKLTSLGGDVFLVRQNGVGAFEVENLAYSDSHMTFQQLEEAAHIDLWKVIEQKR